MLISADLAGVASTTVIPAGGGSADATALTPALGVMVGATETAGAAAALGTAGGGDAADKLGGTLVATDGVAAEAISTRVCGFIVAWVEAAGCAACACAGEAGVPTGTSAGIGASGAVCTGAVR